MLVSEYLNQWVEQRRTYVRIRTLESYQSTIRLHIAPAIGCKKLRKLKPEDISSMLSAIADSGHTRTAQMAFVVLKAALSDAVLCGLIDRSPMAALKKPTHRPQMRPYLSHAQLSAYVAAALADKYALAWMLALMCGLRRGEIIGLRWEDVDMSNGLIHVCNQRIRAGGQLIDAPPKSASGDRFVPIPEPVNQLLKQQERARGYLVQLSPDGLDKAHKRLCKTCGLPPVTPHGLRHTMASQAIGAGVHIKTLQTILGHASYATTADIYAHVDLHLQRAAIASIAASVVY